jgi:hypothetical protein
LKPSTIACATVFCISAIEGLGAAGAGGGVVSVAGGGVGFDATGGDGLCAGFVSLSPPPQAHNRTAIHKL